MYDKVKHGKERKKESLRTSAYIKRTKFRRTGLVKSKKAAGRSSYTTARHLPLKIREVES